MSQNQTKLREHENKLIRSLKRLAEHHNDGEPFFFDDGFLGELEDNIVEEITENCAGVSVKERSEYLVRIGRRLKGTLEELPVPCTSEGRNFREALEPYIERIFNCLEENYPATSSELDEVIWNSIEGHHGALDKILIRLEGPSTIDQLTKAKNHLLNNKNRLHLSNPFAFEKSERESIKENLQDLHNRYNDVFKLIDSQIERNKASLSGQPGQSLEDSGKRMRVIALKFAIENTLMDTEEEADKIARTYGWTSANSGKKLKQYFDFYRKTLNRIGEGSKKETEAKIKVYKEVLKIISEDFKPRALDELQTLNAKYNALFE